MKKWMCFLLAGVLFLSLTACKKAVVSDSPGTQASASTPDTQPQAQPPEAEALYKAFLAGNLQATDASGETVSVSKYENASQKESEGKYALYDMNGDAVPELIVKTPWYFDIYTVKDGTVHLYHENTPNCTVLNDGTLLYKRSGGGPTNVVYQYIRLDADGRETYRIQFAEYIPDGNADPVYFINGVTVERAAYEAVAGELLSIGQDRILWKYLNDGSAVADYQSFMAALKAKGSQAVYLLRDIDGGGSQELLLQENAVLTVYNDGMAMVGEYDYGTGTFRMLSADDPQYPGIFTFWMGGGVNHYGYLTIRDGKLSHETLWEEAYSLPENEPGRTREFSDDKELLDASKTAYAQNRELQFKRLGADISLTDEQLLQVLRNERSFTTDDGNVHRMENYKFQGSREAVVDRYAFVDFDGNGVNELVAYMAPDLGYMVFYWEQGTVYGYGFDVRWMESLKADGTHMASGGAASSAYYALSFKDGKCEKTEIAYHDGIPGVENSSQREQYRIDGKAVTPEEFVKFRTAFESKPDVKWIPFLT